MTKTTLTYNFHYDGGHAWLEVDIGELAIMDMFKKKLISPYSYRNFDKVYLEEDCDAPLFTNELKRMGYEIDFLEVNDGDNSIIRSYNRFNYRLR